MDVAHDLLQNTTVAATGASPGQLMFNGLMRTNLPALPASFRPSLPDLEQIQETICLKLDDQNGWHQTVVVQGHAGTPRSFIVRTDNGRTLWCNMNHLKPHQSSPPNMPLSNGNPGPMSTTYHPLPPMTKVMAFPSPPTVNTIPVGWEVPPRPPDPLSHSLFHVLSSFAY